MSDEYKKNNSDDIDSFFEQFDKISDDFTKSFPEHESTHRSFSESVRAAEAEQQASDSQTRRKTRSERLAEERRGKDGESGVGAQIVDFFKKVIATVVLAVEALRDYLFSDDDAGEADAETGVSMDKSKRRKKKYRLNKKKLLKFCGAVALAFCLIVGIYGVIIVATAPDINPDTIYSLLNESSVLYDDSGEMVDTVSGGETRTNVEYDELPTNLVNAVIAIEDKTFKTHNGFNVIRIFGAIKDAVVHFDRISGTSTITQQLARNVYLKEDAHKRSLKRKIAEMYYTILIEKALSKEQIMEAYLNTIYLGFDSYGVEMAAQSYFSKSVGELDLTECAAIAALPKAPNAYALVKRLEPEDVDPDNDIILYTGNDYTYVYNGDKSKDRREKTLKNMYEFGYITEDEMNAALEDNLLEHININENSLTQLSSYYTDYVVSQVISDLMEQNNMDEQEAKDMVYSGGLQIYTTMDSNAQKVVETEFSKNSNFPSVAKISKDSEGNVLGKNGSVLLYDYNNFFDGEGNFTFKSGEYKWLSDGSLKIYKGHRLNIYNVQGSSGKKTAQIEFKNMYVVEDGVFYSIGGGAVLLPEGYASRDDDGNAIIDASFFDKKEFETGPQQFFKENSSGGLYIDRGHYSLQQKVVQPQSAIVITDYSNGHIKAMAGGRNISGQKLFNRATSTRQPGSSIKPITVYGAALQKSAEILEGGSTPNFSTSNNMYGAFMTAASVIDDSPLVINGKTWPKNWYSGYRGLYTLRTSVEQSVNVNAVKVFTEVGASYASEFAKKLGITSIVKSGETNDMNAAALALGGMTKGISPLELASAYGTYPNEGTYVEPIIYTKITNQRGEVILEKKTTSHDVVDPGVAFIMTDILRTTVSEGIAGKAAIGVQPVGGKTGTTTDNYDAWFVGFTPQYSAALWIGNDVNIELSTGSSAAAGLWSKIMKQVCAGFSAGSFPSAPSNVISVTIDTKSGKLPTELSYLDSRGTVRAEYFIKGTEPTTSDDVHMYASVCSESGYLATPSCYATYPKFGVMRPYNVNTSVGDLAYELPHYYCPTHNPDTSRYPISPDYGGSGDSASSSDVSISQPSNGSAAEDNIPDDDPGWSDVVEPDDGGENTKPDWL